MCPWCTYCSCNGEKKLPPPLIFCQKFRNDLISTPIRILNLHQWSQFFSIMLQGVCILIIYHLFWCMLWESVISSQLHLFVLQILAFLATPMYHMYSACVSHIIHCNVAYLVFLNSYDYYLSSNVQFVPMSHILNILQGKKLPLPP